MKQVFLQRIFAPMSNYFHPQTGSGDNVRTTGSATEAVEYFIVPTDGILRNLYVQLNDAPTAGKSHTWTLRKNGSDTSVVVTIADAATSGDSGGNFEDVTAGDLITIQAGSSGTPANTSGAIAIEFDTDTIGYSVMTGGMPDFAAGGFRTPGFWDGNTTHVYNEIVIPHDMTVKAIYMNCAVAPGVGKSRTLTFSRVGGGFSQAVQVADANTAANVTGLSGSFSQGDRMTVAVAVASGPAASDVRYTLLIESGVNGMSIVPVRAARFARFTGWTPFVGNTHGNANDGSSTMLAWCGPTEFEMKNFFYRANAIVHASDSKDFTLFKNGTDSALAMLNISNTDNASDTTNTVPFAEGDSLIVEHVHTGASGSTTSDGSLTMSQFISPGSPKGLPLLFAG